MKCFIIAQVVDNYNRVVGYKLFDADRGDTMVVTTEQVKAVLTKQPDLIKNASLINNTLSGTNGKLDRYARVNKNGQLVNGDKSPLVVLNKIDNVGYTVVDFKGQTAKISNEKAVNYAKENGIANGKVITQDSLEFISSISGEYETIKIAPSKVGSNTKINIPIRIDGDAKTVAKHTAEDIETEMEYNDVFQSMNSEQRNVLKQYYTWYTVDTYKKMAKNVRLNLAPGKAEKLAQLRGIDKWEFAGINDSYMEGNFKAHCELGHRLRYEYFAIPEGVLDENHKVKTRSTVGYMRARKDAVTELREAGAIVFGETCAGDFFNIAPDDMKKLVKTRKTMSDEIELMSNILTNHLEESYKSNCKMLYQVIAKLGNVENVVKAFGDNVGYTLLSFIKAKMPFPMSLVILAADQARKDKLGFYTTLYPEYKDIIKIMLDTTKDEETQKNAATAVAAGGYLLQFIAEYTLEGKYQYDPTTDQDNTRKDIGRYNKETRSVRDAIVSSLILNTSVNVRIMDNLDMLTNYLKVFKFYHELSNHVMEKYTNSSLKDIYGTIDKFPRQYENIINSYDTETKELLGEMNTELVAMIDSSFPFIDKIKTGFYPYIAYGGYSAHCRQTTFKKISNYGRIQRIEVWKNIGEIAESVDNLGKTPKEVAEEGLYPLIAYIDKKNEEERKKDRYIKLSVTSDTLLNKYVDDSTVVAKLDYICYEEFIKAFVDRNSSYAINTNSINDNSILLNIDEIKDYSMISRLDYEYYIDSIKRNRERARIKREIEERTQREEQERLAKLAEQQRLEREAAARKEQEEEAKLDRLKKLLDEYTGDSKDYGVQTARAILNQGIVYSKLSPKQRWRIDKTLKDLENQKENEGKLKEYNFDQININGEIVEKDKPVDKSVVKEYKTVEKKATSIINEENIQALNDEETANAVRELLTKVKIKEESDGEIAFATKVALTVNKTGKISDKQKNYLLKGYKKLERRGK